MDCLNIQGPEGRHSRKHKTQPTNKEESIILRRIIIFSVRVHDISYYVFIMVYALKLLRLLNIYPQRQILNKNYTHTYIKVYIYIKYMQKYELYIIYIKLH